jgi:hypothetical protein
MWRRFKAEFRDGVELALLPGLAALLPWSWCFAVFKRLARLRWLYAHQVEAAYCQARRYGWAGEDEAHWRWTRRLVTLVDHADYYLVLTRSDAWLKRHVVVRGAWYAPSQASLLLTFHWGAGMWSLNHAAAAGLKVHSLVAALDGAHFAGRQILRRYAMARTAMMSHISGPATLDVSGSLRPVLRALKAKEQVFAVVDVPADQVSASQQIQLLGFQARVPRALFRVAVEQKVPVTVYRVGVNLDDGQRLLLIQQFGVYEDVDALIKDVFQVLEQAIQETPAAWHFWGEAERFFGQVGVTSG